MGGDRQDGRLFGGGQFTLHRDPVEATKEKHGTTEDYDDGPQPAVEGAREKDNHNKITLLL